MRATCSVAARTPSSRSSTRTPTLVKDYLATAIALGASIVAVFETHVQADHVSGLPALVGRLQRRSLYGYLGEVLTAKSRGDPIPELA